MRNLLLALCLITSILLTGWSSISANSDQLESLIQEPTLSSEEEESTLEMMVGPTQADKPIEKLFGEQKEMSMEEIFGSEQVFPFEPGFS